MYMQEICIGGGRGGETARRVLSKLPIGFHSVVPVVNGKNG